MSNIGQCAEIQLPALHDAANTASQRAQRLYLRLVRLNLSALFVGAAAGAVALPSGLVGQLIAGVSAVALLAALVITLVMQNKAYERTWYGGRAVAESVKTLAWRYMTRAEPFDADDVAATDALFVARLRQILAQSATLNINLAAAGADQITPRMRDVRERSLSDRRDFYATCRISEQRAWYSNKADISDAAERKFFAAVWGSNALAAMAAVAMIIWPIVPLNLTGVFSTVAAALFAWLQVRRHQELSQSYALTAQELSLVLAKAPHLTSESTFSEFVADAEAAISREHTLWVARRDAGITVSAS